MYPKHIEELDRKVSIGTRVTIVYQPVKIGWDNKNLYLEAHPDVLDRYTDLFREALRFIGHYARGYDVVTSWHKTLQNNHTVCHIGLENSEMPPCDF